MFKRKGPYLSQFTIHCTMSTTGSLLVSVALGSDHMAPGDQFQPQIYGYFLVCKSQILNRLTQIKHLNCINPKETSCASECSKLQ